MSKKFDLYITFPAQLATINPNLVHFCEQAVEHLKVAVERIYKKQVSTCIKGKDFNATDYSVALNDSHLAVFFIHPESEADPDYNGELEEICNVMLSKDDDQIGNYSRVFKISIEPVEKPLSPACLNELMSYDFFERNIYNRKIKTIEFNSENGSSVLYSRMLDLAYDISSVLSLEHAGRRNRAEQDKFIYLGLTTFDQQQARDDIKRELQHYGFRVLPYTRLPQSGEEFEKAVVSNLRKSDTAIQIMGSQYGEILKGTKYSLTDYQNRIIREFQQNNPENGLNRFIWIPQNNKISDQRQALYLKRLRRDDAFLNSEIIESPLETFKTILASKLNSKNHNNKVEYENIHRIYLLAEETDMVETEEVFSTLVLSGLKVTQLDYNEQVGIYARHLQALRDSDAVVIYQTSQNVFWLNSKIRDLIKSPGIGRERPFKKVVIVTRLTPDSNLIRMIKTKVVIVNTDGAEPELILQKLISE